MKVVFRPGENASLLYIRYKKYLVSAAVIVVSLLAFLLVVPSQITNVLKLRTESLKRDEEVKVLTTNFDTLSKEKEVDFDTNLRLVSQAIPDTKDFDGIISGISYAGISSGVSISDYGLDIGDTSPEYSKIGVISSLALTLTIDGGVAGAQRFLKELSRAFPLSEVTEMQTTGTTSRISVNFYFKPFPPAKLEKDKPVALLSKTEKELLKTLTGYGNSLSGRPVFSPPPATSSAF